MSLDNNNGWFFQGFPPFYFKVASGHFVWSKFPPFFFDWISRQFVLVPINEPYVRIFNTRCFVWTWNWWMSWLPTTVKKIIPPKDVWLLKSEVWRPRENCGLLFHFQLRKCKKIIVKSCDFLSRNLKKARQKGNEHTYSYWSACFKPFGSNGATFEQKFFTKYRNCCSWKAFSRQEGGAQNMVLKFKRIPLWQIWKAMLVSRPAYTATTKSNLFF